MQTIFLIGFMGSGKSSFGKKLAARLKLKFVDLDEFVAQTNEMHDVQQLIEEKGMDFFREAESEVLKSIKPENWVISTGGGTPCFFDNLDWMKRRGVVVFLNVDESHIFSRLSSSDFEKRPLLKGLDKEGLKNFIHVKLQERLPYYNQAHIIFDPVNEKIETLTGKIAELAAPK
jgi:shikimate kinase